MARQDGIVALLVILLGIGMASNASASFRKLSQMLPDQPGGAQAMPGADQSANPLAQLQPLIDAGQAILSGGGGANALGGGLPLATGGGQSAGGGMPVDAGLPSPAGAGGGPPDLTGAGGGGQAGTGLPAGGDQGAPLLPAGGDGATTGAGPVVPGGDQPAAGQPATTQPIPPTK